MPRIPINRFLIISALVFVIATQMSCMKQSSKLESITITPAQSVMVIGGAQQLTATATFSDGMTLNWTAAVNWTSKAPDSVTITNSGTAPGVASAVASTTPITITATDIGNPGIYAQATIQVTNGPLVTIDVTPQFPDIAVAGTQDFHAQGTYADSEQIDITNMVTWTSSNTGVATISNIISGNTTTVQATGVAGGTTIITATDPATQIIGYTALTVHAQ